MSNTKNINVITINSPFYFLFAIGTAMIGYNIHDSIFWSFIDFFFAPLVWIKWLIMHQVNLSIIKETFNFFLK